DLSLEDGVGIHYEARWLGNPLPERDAGSEQIFLLAADAAREGWRIFLLGAAPGVAEETAAILCAAYPGLRIAGTYAGSPAPEQNEAIVERINRSRADLLFVAYGVPQEEKWIDRNRSRLETVRVAIGVGGAFDFVAGRTVRAPEWVQRVGLEWAHRLLRQPWRWRRMLALPHFTLRVLRTRRREP
ncbi:MAG: WecB/TagA/CpsF family glycosyltransferase, partial [Candidatus Promineifilaceae bacterium]|nr:WecB/TagA/CpsF family glycosyltransferase [Candidatus Promineifilaceae bacterium]